MALAHTEAQFWAHGIRDSATGCLLWSGARFPTGYGIASWKGRSWRAHRLAWTLSKGPIPKGLLVCHRCDVPGCFAPEHLFLGSAADNAADMAKKGRAWRPAGSLHPCAKLDEQRVMAIRAAVERGEPQAAVAEAFGITTSSVQKIWRRRTWRHV